MADRTGTPPPSRSGTTLATIQEPTPQSSLNSSTRAPNGTPDTKPLTAAATTKLATSGLSIVSHSADNPTPTQARLPKASTNLEWGPPLGLHIRSPKDEPLMIFRRAVGINSDLAAPARSPAKSELGLRQPTGMYLAIIEERRRRRWQHSIVSWSLNVVHVTQIVIAATLTALGPNAGRYTMPITVLGALNAVIAGVLALLKGQGLPERLHKDEMMYERLQEWIEETEALLMTGIIGRDNRDIGVLVESAFKKFNSAKLSEENNRPDNYVPDPGSTDTKKKLQCAHGLDESKPANG